MASPVNLIVTIPARPALQSKILLTIAWLEGVESVTPAQGKVWLERRAKRLLYIDLRRENRNREAEQLADLDFSEEE